MAAHQAVGLHQSDHDSRSGSDSEKSGDIRTCQIGANKRYQKDCPTERAENIERGHDDAAEIVALDAPGEALPAVLEAIVSRLLVCSIAVH